MESRRVDLFLGIDERLGTPPQCSRSGKTGFFPPSIVDLYSTLFWVQLCFYFFNSPSTNRLHTYLQHPPIRWPTRTVARSLEQRDNYLGTHKYVYFQTRVLTQSGPSAAVYQDSSSGVAADCLRGVYGYSVFRNCDNLESSGRVTACVNHHEKASAVRGRVALTSTRAPAFLTCVMNPRKHTLLKFTFSLECVL